MEKKKNRDKARFWWKVLTDYDFFSKMTGLKVVMKKIDAFFEVFQFILFRGARLFQVSRGNVFQKQNFAIDVKHFDFHG